MLQAGEKVDLALELLDGFGGVSARGVETAVERHLLDGEELAGVAVEAEEDAAEGARAEGVAAGPSSGEGRSRGEVEAAADGVGIVAATAADRLRADGLAAAAAAMAGLARGAVGHDGGEIHE